MTSSLRFPLAAVALAAVCAAPALATDNISVTIQNASASAPVPMALAVTPPPGESSFSGVGGGCPPSYVAAPASNQQVCALTTNVEPFTRFSAFTLTLSAPAGQPAWSACYVVNDPMIGPMYAWPCGGSPPMPCNPVCASPPNTGDLQAEAPFTYANFAQTGDSQYQLALGLPASSVSLPRRTVSVGASGEASVRISCPPGATCRLGAVRLTASLPGRSRTANGIESSPSRPESLVAVGPRSVAIPAGRTSTVTMRMSERAQRAYTRAGAVRVPAHLVTVGRNADRTTSHLRHPVVLEFSR